MIVAGERKLAPLLLNGIDLMLESWADYVMVYPYSLDAEKFISCLKSALDINPYFSGRKFSKDGLEVFITGANEGVLLELQEFDEELPPAFLRNEYDGFELFCDRTFREQHRLSRSSFKHPLFQLKLSMFEGASVLGISAWHSLTDGSTFFNFIQLMSKLYCGDEVSELLPDFSRLDPGSCNEAPDAVVDLWSPSEAVRGGVTFAEGTFILNEGFLNGIVGDFDCVGFMRYDYIVAHAWKHIVASMVLDVDSHVSLYPVYDARQLTSMGPNYVGNLLCYPSIQLTSSGIAGMALDELSDLIREGAFDLVVKGDDLLAELQDVATFTQRNARGRYLLAPLYESLNGNGLLFNNLMAIPYQRFDFGMGGPSHIDVPLSDPIRFVQLLPCPHQPGCLVMKVNLPEVELRLFSENYQKELFE